MASKRRSWSLFTSLDDGWSSDLSLTDFDSNLVQTVLLQEKSFTLPSSLVDSFFVVEYMKRCQSNKVDFHRSFFGSALRLGWIAPMIYNDVDSFEDEIDEARKRYGKELVNEYLRKGDLVQYVYEAVRQGQTYNRRDCTSELGFREGLYQIPSQARGNGVSLRLEKVYKETLLQENHPARLSGSNKADLHRKKLWRDTEAFRIKVVNKALDRMAHEGRVGLRQTEVFEELATEIGIGSQVESKYVSSKYYLAAAPTTRKPALKAFLRWLPQLYYTAFAGLVDLPSNFASYSFGNDFLLSHVRREELAPGPERTDKPLSFVIELPHPRVLIECNIHDIQELRQEEGYKYWASIHAWERNPHDKEKRRSVRKALKEYASKVTKFCGKKYPQHNQLFGITLGRLTELPIATGRISDFLALPSTLTELAGAGCALSIARNSLKTFQSGIGYLMSECASTPTRQVKGDIRLHTIQLGNGGPTGEKSPA